jgi:hypothetical protein
MNLQKSDYREQLLEKIMAIDTESLSNEIEITSTSTIIEDQKVYFWIRLYISEEDPNLQIGDDISIEWTISGEKLDT